MSIESILYIANSVLVTRHYYRNVDKSRALSRTTTARQYMKDLDKSRKKMRHSYNRERVFVEHRDKLDKH